MCWWWSLGAFPAHADTVHSSCFPSRAQDEMKVPRLIGQVPPKFRPGISCPTQEIRLLLSPSLQSRVWFAAGFLIQNPPEHTVEHLRELLPALGAGAAIPTPPIQKV